MFEQIKQASKIARLTELRKKLPEVSELQIKPRKGTRAQANRETDRVERNTLQKGDTTPETQLKEKRRILKHLSKSKHSSLSIKIYHLR